MSGRYVHNNGQFQQQTLGFDLNLTVQRYLHDAGYLTGHAGKFLHRLDLSVEAPHAPSIAEPRYASATVPAHQPDPSYMDRGAGQHPGHLHQRQRLPAGRAQDHREVPALPQGR